MKTVLLKCPGLRRIFCLRGHKIILLLSAVRETDSAGLYPDCRTRESNRPRGTTRNKGKNSGTCSGKGRENRKKSQTNRQKTPLCLSGRV